MFSEDPICSGAASGYHSSPGGMTLTGIEIKHIPTISSLHTKESPPNRKSTCFPLFVPPLVSISDESSGKSCTSG